MTRHFLACNITRAVYFATVTACFSLRVVVVKAQDAATKSVPRDYALFSQTTNGRKVPKFVVRVDTYQYPTGTSYRQFLTAGIPRTPEEVLARYVQLLLAPRPNADACLELFAPAKRRTEKDCKELRDGYLELRPDARQVGNPRLKRRYDFGNSSQIDVDFPDLGKPNSKNKKAFWAVLGFSLTATSFERISDRVYLNPSSIFSGDASDVVGLLFSRTPSESKQTGLPYSVTVADASPATKNVHPMQVLFDGTPSNVPLDGKTQTPDAAANFLQHAAQVLRTDKISDILPLWDAASAKELRASLKPKGFEQGNYEEEKALLSDTSRRIAFVMSFDEGAIIFLRNPKASGHEPLFVPVPVFKENGAYKLSWESRSDINSRNLDNLLKANYFQKYLLKITAAPVKSAP